MGNANRLMKRRERAKHERENPLPSADPQSLKPDSSPRTVDAKLRESNGESKIDMPLWGIPLSFLLEWTEKNVQDRAETTSQVCSRVILPQTKQRRCSMVDYCALTGTKANRFISHSWSYSFVQVVETIVAFEKSRGTKDLSSVCVWMDTLVVNQHDAPVRKQEWWSSTFHSAINEIGSVILVVQPWYDPKALTRAWCLWEIYGSARYGANFHIALPPDQKDHFLQTLVTDFKSIQKLLSLVDSAKAEATNAADLTMIRTAIELSIGYEGVNRMVLTQMRSWLVDSALEALEKIKNRKLENHPELSTRTGEALMENQIARLYNLQGNLQLAMEHQQRAYDLDQMEDTERGGDAPNNDLKEKISRDLNNLGYLSLKKGDLDRAAEHLIAARNLRIDIYGAESPEVARTEFNLGEVYETRSQLEECLELYQRAGKHLLSAGLPLDALKVFQGLGRVYKLRGELSKAEESFTRALELGGSDSVHPDVAEAWGMYAALLTDTDRFEEAREALESARAIQVRNLGSEHPNIAEIDNNMARLLSRLGEYEKALEHQREALRIDQRAMGEKHLVCARDRNNLCHLLTSLGRLEEAKEQVTIAIEIRASVLGRAHPLYARTLCNLAKVEMVSGDLRAALEKYLQAKDVMTKVNPRHQDVGEIDSMIAECQYAAGEYESSVESFNRAIANSECTDSSRVMWKLMLAKCLTDHVQFEEAKRILDEAEALSNTVSSMLPPAQGNMYLVDILSGRARWLEGTGDVPGAIEYQRKALQEGLARGKGETLDAARDWNNLGFLLTERPTSIDGLNEGIEALKKALKIRERALGSQNPATMRTQYNLELALVELEQLTEGSSTRGINSLRQCVADFDQGQNRVHALVANLGLLKVLLFEKSNDSYRVEAQTYLQSQMDWIDKTFDDNNPLKWEVKMVLAYAERHDTVELQRVLDKYIASIRNLKSMNLPLFLLWSAEVESDEPAKAARLEQVRKYCAELNLYDSHRFVVRCKLDHL